MVYITTFFVLFYVISAIGVVWYFLPERFKRNNRKEVKIELYDNGDYSETPSIAISGRTGNAVVRSSVRYHQGLYFTETEYEQYRDEVLKTELP